MLGSRQCLGQRISRRFALDPRRLSRGEQVQLTRVSLLGEAAGSPVSQQMANVCKCQPSTAVVLSHAHPERERESQHESTAKPNLSALFWVNRWAPLQGLRPSDAELHNNARTDPFRPRVRRGALDVVSADAEGVAARGYAWRCERAGGRKPWVKQRCSESDC